MAGANTPATEVRFPLNCLRSSSLQEYTPKLKFHYPAFCYVAVG